MKSVSVALLGILAFAPRAFSQTQAPNVPVVITSDYYALPKVLVLHALNNSGKDITGYTIIIRHKKADGRLDENGRSEHTEDMLGRLITTQMAKDAGASEQIRLENSANAIFPADTGIFVAGTTRDLTMTGIESGSDLDAIAGAVFYVDGTYDEQDKDAFKRALANRQGPLQQMKEEDELIRNALADRANEHPVAAVLTELNKRRVEAMDKAGHTFFPMDHSTLQYIQRPQKGTTERERLAQYVDEQEKRVELMTPHCHLEIAPLHR